MDSLVIRRARADEAVALRELRLRALRDAPAAFLTTAAQAEALPDDEWATRARRFAVDDAGGRIHRVQSTGARPLTVTVQPRTGGGYDCVQRGPDPFYGLLRTREVAWRVNGEGVEIEPSHLPSDHAQPGDTLVCELTITRQALPKAAARRTQAQTG